MNSSITSVSEILNNAQKLTCAEFSDNYNFDDTNAGEYFDEMIREAAFTNPIFSGIIIMEKSGNKFTIIDGLQRLTTISLLLCALCESYKNTTEKNEEAKNKIFERFLIHKKEPKLKLKGEQRNVYRKILFAEELNENESNSNLALTYKCFLNKIKKLAISGNEFYKIISKIEFMFILTDKSEVSVKELYQTLNLNKDKSQINLILNFIGQRSTAKEIPWQKTLLSYQHSGTEDLFESFIKDFLIIQNDGKPPSKNALYNNFKSYFGKMSNYQNDSQIIDTLCKYSQYYLKIIKADFGDEAVKEQIDTLNQNNGKDAYPYLMEVLDDLANGLINDEMFLNILTMINSFIQDREENTLANVTISFASLSKEINKMLVLKDYTPQLIDENKLTINEVNNLSTFEI